MPTLIITPKPTPVAFTARTHYAQSHSESALIADFGSIPPEINSARIYAGPGPGSLLTAATTWDALAADLYEAAGSHYAVASTMTTESCLGPASVAMLGATTPYLAWLHDTAALAAHTARQARAAVAAYDAARAMTVPPSVVAANRSQLAMLATANALGLHTHAIATNEALYREMWAQDSTAMYMYADTSADASSVTPFLPPPGTIGEVNVSRTRGRVASSTTVPALQRLASASGSVGRVAVTAGVGKAAAVGALSTPRGWFTAASVGGSAAPAPGAWSAAPISAMPAVPMLPTARTAGHGVDSYVPTARPGLRTIVRMRSSG